MFLTVVVVSALTIGGIAISLTSQARHINMVARNANQTALELKAQAAARRALRNKQLAELQATAVEDCQGRHKIITVLIAVVSTSPLPPGLTQAQRAFEKLQTVRIIAALRSADCSGVKPLPKT